MIHADDSSKRHTIPRWRSISGAIAAGEMSSLPRRKTSDVQDLLVSETQARLTRTFDDLATKWLQSKSPELAEELVSTAVISDRLGEAVVIEAATSITEDEHQPKSLKRYAQKIVEGISSRGNKPLPEDEAGIRASIARRKRLLRFNPRDALRAAETALLYANIGQLASSENLLMRALKLAPHDRYVLRAAARLYTHLGEPDRALHFLKKSGRTNFDPWLKAAELAVAGELGESPQGWKLAKRIADNSQFSFVDRSELASELGTLELLDGSRKKAMKLFQTATESMNENSFAQIEWAGRYTKAFEPEGLLKNISISHEAVANAASWHSDWDVSLKACEEWSKIEPFSAKPAILASFVASISADGGESERKNRLFRGIAAAEKGLLANPDSFTIHNNMSVLMSYSGETEAALRSIAEMQRLSSSPEDKVLIDAACGLAEFRSNQVDQGIESYARAIERAIDAKQPVNALRAFSFLGREVSRVSGASAEFFVAEIDQITEEFKRRSVSVPRDVTLLRNEIQKCVESDNGEASLDLSRLNMIQKLNDDE